MDAFERFTRADAETVLSLEDGGFLASVACFYGCWSWVVWHDNRALAGGRSFHMSAPDACEAAVRAIEARRGEHRPGGDAPGLWKGGDVL